MKSVIVHAMLAVLGLGFAYQTWTRTPDDQAPAAGEVAVSTCDARSFESIEIENPTHVITAVPERGKDGTSYWITSKRKAKAAPHAGDAGVQDSPTVQANAADQGKRFLANAAFVDYMKRILPLRALRPLGTLPKDKLADFGFDKVGTHLTLSCGGKRVRIEVGARTFGTGQRYVRDEKSHAAYLFEEPIIADLQSAQFKFMQSDLHAFELADIDEAIVEARSARKRLLQRDRKHGDKAMWVDANAPEKRNALYGNWFTRLSRLRVRDYLPASAQPGSDLAQSGAIVPVLSVAYATDGKPKGKLELVRSTGPEGARYYARSETTGGWVTVFDSTAKDVEQDVGMVVGLDDVPAEKAAPAPAGDAKGLPVGHPVLPAPHAPPHAPPTAPQP
jgi:hypothetical protein